MGSEFPIPAAQLRRVAALAAALVGAATAHADTPPAQLLKDGIDAYKAGKYDVAAMLLGRSYEVDPKPDTLFALAQSERLSNDCKSAIVHYKKLLEQTGSLDTAKLIQSNLLLCDRSALDPPAKTDKPVETSPETKIVIKEVPVDSGGTSMLNVALVAGGTAALGAAIGFGLVSSSAREDATSSRTFDKFNELNDRADRYRNFAFVAGGVGVACIGIAAVRWALGGAASATKSEPTVGIAPSADGPTLFVSSRW